MKLIRNLALVAIAAGALLAIPASASASGGFAADSYPASVHGSGGKLTLHTTGGSLVQECNSPVLDENHERPAHTLALAGTEKGACAVGFANMNNCELILHTGSSPTAEIGPPGCTGVGVTAGCGITIKPQTGIPLTYVGTHYDGVDFLTGIKVSGTVSTEPAFCASSMKLTANWNLATTNGAKESINLVAFRDSVPVGISLSNEKHPRTTAQAFPVNVAANVRNVVSTPANLLEKLGAVKVNASCYRANLGAGELTKEAESAFSFSGAYWGRAKEPESKFCDSAFGTYTVSMNSCRYELPEVELVEGTYNVKGAALACTKEGDGITLTNSFCSVTIPAQSLQATLQNGGSGFGAEIQVKFTSNSLKYTTSGPFCSLAGVKSSGEDGVMNQELSLRGTLPG